MTDEHAKPEEVFRFCRDEPELGMVNLATEPVLAEYLFVRKRAHAW